jgi:hypothetical protein
MTAFGDDLQGKQIAEEIRSNQALPRFFTGRIISMCLRRHH